MLNNYIRQELASVKQAMTLLREAIDETRKNLTALAEARDHMVSRLERLEHEIERQEQYHTNVYIPNELAALLGEYMQARIPERQDEYS